MRLFRFPSPWDYHNSGGFLVQAETLEDATARLRARVDAETERDGYTSYRHEYIEWDKAHEVTDTIYEESGCDC